LSGSDPLVVLEFGEEGLLLEPAEEVKGGLEQEEQPEVGNKDESKGSALHDSQPERGRAATKEEF